MMEAIPKSWISSKFTIRSPEGDLAELDFRVLRENGSIDIGPQGFVVRRENLMSGDFLLESPSGILARAKITSPWVRRFALHYADGTYELRARSPFSSEFLLLEEGRQIGSVAPQSIWTRRASARLPDDWPLPVRLFVFWLVLLMWRRTTAAAAGAAASTG